MVAVPAPAKSVAASAKAPAAATKKSAASATTHTWVRHIRGAVNLRRGPATTSARLTTLRNGTRLVIFGRHADGHGRVWYHVHAAGRTGWVAGWLTR